MGIANLDRRVIRTDGPDPIGGKLSAYRDLARYVLLGEPGIGKSTAFEREASLADTRIVRAIDFVAGDRPPGRTVFIDALEEYRIGEAGIDRLYSLIKALKEADYAHWRIACRAISLPPPDALRVRTTLGTYATLQMDLLDAVEQRALLLAAGEANPPAFIESIASFGADALLGNPATLLLLRKTLARSTVKLDTREALFAEATRQMSDERNPEMPVLRERPAPSQIESAAEAACLVLLLSVRSDLWLYAGDPPHESVVTKDDLLQGKVDPLALLAAVDTAMFKGDAAGFQPTHRVVAEYLAGRALARAVAPIDPTVPALPLYRALAFCTGDNDRPAPALTGVFAWFVTALAISPLADRALKLIELDPEAVLFHGDAAALPTAQRVALLDLVGRGDPWFLGAVRGSSAIGGLAGEDLADQLRAILNDPQETPHRRTMVLEALATGRPVASLADDVRKIVVTPSSDHYTRRRALDGYAHIVGDATDALRALLDDMKGEPYATAAEVRAELAAKLVRAGAIGVDEVREILVGYATSGDGVMGYAGGLAQAIIDTGLPGLFDAPIGVEYQTGDSHSFEIKSLINRLFAATVEANLSASATQLLTWLQHADIDEDDRIDEPVQVAFARWLDAASEHEQALIDALDDAISRGSERLWRVDFDFRRLTGRKPTLALRLRAIEQVEDATDAQVYDRAKRAYYLVQPFDEWPELYWRLFAAVEHRPQAAEWYDHLTTCAVEGWRAKNAKRSRDNDAKLEAQNQTDREWLRPRIDGLRDGSLTYPLRYASDIYNGYRGSDGGTGIERVTNWLGNDTALIAAIREGWGHQLQLSVSTPDAEGRKATQSRWSTAELMVIAWAEWRLHDGLTLDLTLPFAFRVLRHAYATNDSADVLRQLALDRIYSDPDGAKALKDYWAAAIRQKSADLPQRHYVDTGQPVVVDAIRGILRTHRNMSPGVLSDLLHLAASTLPPAEILLYAARALKRTLPLPIRQLWAMAAFLLAPEQHAALLASDLNDDAAIALFQGLWEGPLTPLLQAANDSIVVRGEIILRHLGPKHGPPKRMMSNIDRLGEMITNTATQLSRQLSDDATRALDRLIAEPALPLWHNTLVHLRTQHLTALREALFRPPLPRSVALALVAGPPATPADLRAVVRHTIDQLVADIRNGDTSPWRQFWNRPYRKAASPRIENDCRDLLTDRLRDRLERYGIPVKGTSTETRSESDRRADVVILGDGAAALPIEVKRHSNTDLWTAVTRQLHPYTRSAGSNGHGILLVFWFGAVGGAVPAPPDGAAAPKTLDQLGTMLRERLSAEDRDKVEVVIVDVSDPKLEAGAAEGSAATARPARRTAARPRKGAGAPLRQNAKKK